jgi:hypothetical protein
VGDSGQNGQQQGGGPPWAQQQAQSSWWQALDWRAAALAFGVLFIALALQAIALNGLRRLKGTNPEASASS